MRASGEPQKRQEQPDVVELVPKHELDRAEQQIEKLQQDHERLRRENDRLRRELEAALRAGKRQAAPHSRGRLKAKPKRPGRKPGRHYGKQACRPTPALVDESIRVPLPRLVALLRRQGVVPAQVKASPGSASGAERWLEAFDQHLEQVAGVSAGRRKNCLHIVRGLLQAAFENSDPEFSQLRAEHVTAFVQTRAGKRAPTCRKDPGSAVLTFLRFLSTAGVIPPDLQYAVPRVRQWTHAALPRFLMTEDLNRVLALPTDSTAKGLRDRAMLLLLARLGLRAGEVATDRVGRYRLARWQDFDSRRQNPP